MVGPLRRARASDAPSRGPWHWQPRLPRDVEPRRVGIHARSPPIVLYVATSTHTQTTRAKSAFKSNKTSTQKTESGDERRRPSLARESAH